MPFFSNIPPIPCRMVIYSGIMIPMPRAAQSAICRIWSLSCRSLLKQTFAFIECWGHLWDIGGAVPGSISPTASSVFQEGVMIPPVRVLHGGVRNEEVVRIFTRNSRFPDMLEGDLNSLMAACNLGCKRLRNVPLCMVQMRWRTLLKRLSARLRLHCSSRSALIYQKAVGHFATA